MFRHAKCELNLKGLIDCCEELLKPNFYSYFCSHFIHLLSELISLSEIDVGVCSGSYCFINVLTVILI